MYKFLFELFTSELTLPIEPLHEYVILVIISAIAFSIGWNVSPGGKWGSLIHWVVRLAAFVGLWFIAGIVLIVAQWIINNRILVVSVVIGILLLIAIISITRLILKKKNVRKEKQNNDNNEEQ